tara:strand:+ start:251 stop:358 length:108 start_codon:yes stop_codon:yes gene_type:complete
MNLPIVEEFATKPELIKEAELNQELDNLDRQENFP